MDHVYFQPVFAAIGTAVVVVALVVVLARILDNLRHIRAYRQELLRILYRKRSRYVCPTANKDIKHAYSFIRKRPATRRGSGGQHGAAEPSRRNA